MKKIYSIKKTSSLVVLLGMSWFGQAQVVETSAKIGFSKNFVTVKEEAGKLNFTFKITAPVSGSVDLVVKESPFSTADANDFTLKSQTLNFTAETPSEYAISIPIINDNLEEQHAEYFVLSLENPVNYTIDGNNLATVYIIDNDRLAPVSSKEIELKSDWSRSD